MPWMSQLLKTYESRAGKMLDEPLTPIAHMNSNAQIEVTLSLDGEFKNASEVPKDNASTLIPVIEASAGRASGIAPHPLCDNLSYIAGDFYHYCNEDKLRKVAQDRFEKYIANLRKWAESEFSHQKVRTILNYLSKRTLAEDLIKSGLLELTEDGFLNHKKVSGQPYEKVLVRFRILGSEGGMDGTWQDTSLIDAYTHYYLSIQHGSKDICYLLGEESTISENHPKGIVAANYGAKLISANDVRGYTYRGRFQNAEQACTISYEASQKIHSALTWLAKTQGAFIGKQDKRTFICWNPEGKKIPDIFNVFSEFGLGEEDDDLKQSTEASYRRNLIRTFQGYRDQFNETDSVIIIALDAATTGRLAITYYNELAASDFLDRIVYWGKTCNWYYLKFNEQQKPYYAVETPIFRRIVECAFGRERDKFIDVDDKVLKEQTQRLVKCMVEGQRIPYDIVHALTIRASMPLAYSQINRENVLSTACALISKHICDRYDIERREEKRSMKLNPDNHDRSYLFGRLLAVLEYVERITYVRGEDRDPNAIRLQSAYVNHPMRTWKTLNDLLRPYFQKLNPGAREYYQRLISEITGSFREEDGEYMNTELKETYLLGYYLQRAELNITKDKEAKKGAQDNE